MFDKYKQREGVIMEALIKLVDITKEFNGQVVLRGINLEIKQNEFVTLLGPSGCGKTTTLRIIGGFVDPSSGDVLFEGESILNVPAYKRPSNTVFQRYALFPHLDVFENVAFGLRVRSNEAIIQRSIVKIKQDYETLIRAEKDPKRKKELKREQAKKVQLTKDPNFDLKYKISEIEFKISKLNRKSETYKEEKSEYLSQIKELKSQFETKKAKEKKLQAKVSKYLSLVGLSGYENRDVSKLSGGQQQRVAIARALINEPQVLLLDEPLAALDLKLRQEMQYELKEIQRNAGITFIYVTHDQEEALTMSDKIVVMNEGEIQQIGTPEDIYNEPENRFVATFIGESNIIPGVMLDDFLVEFDGIKHESIDNGFGKNEEVDVVIRPEDITILKPNLGKFNGIVDSIAFKGVHYEIDVKTKDRVYTIHTTEYHPVGEEVSINFGPDDIHVMEIW